MHVQKKINPNYKYLNYLQLNQAFRLRWALGFRVFCLLQKKSPLSAMEYQVSDDPIVTKITLVKPFFNSRKKS